MDTAGKAVLFCGLTVLISLSAVMLVPSPGVPVDGARDHALRRLHPRRDADPAARRARASSARASTSSSLPWVHSGRAPLAAVRRLGRAPVAAPARLRRRRARGPGRARRCRCSGCKTGMPSIKVVPERRRLARRLHAGPARVRAGRARAAADRRAQARRRRASPRSPAPTPASPRSCRPCPAAAAARWSRPCPTQDPSDPAIGATVDRLRSSLPAGRAGRRRGRREPRPRGGAVGKTPLVIGVVLASASCCCSSRCRRRSSPPSA